MSSQSLSLFLSSSSSANRLRFSHVFSHPFTTHLSLFRSFPISSPFSDHRHHVILYTDHALLFLEGGILVIGKQPRGSLKWRLNRDDRNSTFRLFVHDLNPLRKTIYSFEVLSTICCWSRLLTTDSLLFPRLFQLDWSMRVRAAAKSRVRISHFYMINVTDCEFKIISQSRGRCGQKKYKNGWSGTRIYDGKEKKRRDKWSR